MKKSLILLLVLLISQYHLTAAEEKKEMIVLFDTSVSVLPVYDYFSGYLIQDLTQEHLDNGDLFHLLSFADEPVFEFSQPMLGNEEENRIISYVSVLKPMGQYTDLITALNYLYRFTSDLSLGTKKKILILTDGIHDPPPSSPLYGKDQAFVESSLKDITEKIYRQGWDLRLLQIPTDLQNADNSFIELLTSELGTPAVQFTDEQSHFSNRVMGNPKMIVPESLGDVGYIFKIPIKIINYSTTVQIINLKEILWNDRNILKGKASIEVAPEEEGEFEATVRLPSEIELGEYTLDLDFIFSEGTDVSPDSAKLSINLLEENHRYENSRLIFLFSGIGLLILIILIIIFIRKKVEEPVTHSVGKKDKDDTEPSIHITNPSADRSNDSTGANFSSSDSFSKNETKADLVNSQLKSVKKSDSRYTNTKPGSEYHHGGKNQVSPSQTSEIEEKENNFKKVDSTKTARKIYSNQTAHHINIRKDESHLAVEMYVMGQNPFKENRNISIIKEGHSLQIGSKNESYSIFIINIPGNIGKISYDGKNYTFTPLKIEYFPELKSELKNCLDKYIKVVDSSGRQTRIMFRKWTSPLEKINRIMHMVDKPGIPDFRY